MKSVNFIHRPHSPCCIFSPTRANIVTIKSQCLFNMIYRYVLTCIHVFRANEGCNETCLLREHAVIFFVCVGLFIAPNCMYSEKSLILTSLPFQALLIEGSFLLYLVLVLDELVRSQALTPCWKVLRRIRPCLSRITCK